MKKLDSNKIRKLIVLSIALILCPAIGYCGMAISGPYLLKENQYPKELAQLKPSFIIITASIAYRHTKGNISGDTITNLKPLVDSGDIKIFRLVFTGKDGHIDSVIEFDTRFNRTLVASLSQDYKLKVHVFPPGGNSEEITLNYKNHKRWEWDKADIRKTWGLQETLYSDYEKSHLADAKVWLLSVGINDYGGVKFSNCVSDAVSFGAFFSAQSGWQLGDSSYRGFVLTDKYATRDSILNCLDYIIKNASKNDYFIFNFSGVTTSASETPDTLNDQIYFVPYGVDLKNGGYNLSNMMIKDASVKKSVISLNSLAQKIKFIQANNQLFVVEAGPTLTFKKEFIKGLMQDADRVMNENRVIIVPNGFGRDNIGSIQKGPLNYFITSLDSTTNIFDLFDDKKKKIVSYKLKKAEYNSAQFYKDYFDIFFAKDFYKDMAEFSGRQATRGLEIQSDDNQVIRKYASKKVALVVGTDHYNAGWPKLSNPVFDAIAVKDELEKSYGFEVKLLTEANMDSIYTAIRNLYSTMDSSSQLVLYFAGHGDFESNLFDDGFIVCHDSRPLVDDPNRDTYIPFSKIRKMINKLPAKQILVVMDICYGGTFDNNILGVRERKGASDESSGLNIPAIKRLSSWSKYKTRIVLSSVGNKPALDGAVGKHSPFATLFLKCLRNNETGKFLTTTDIYSVLEQQSISEDVNNRIEPYKGAFGDNEALGEFVFIPIVPLN